MWSALIFLITATCFSSYTPPTWFDNCEEVLQSKLRQLEKLQQDGRITHWPSAETPSGIRQLQAAEKQGWKGWSKWLLASMLPVVQNTIAQQLLWDDCQQKYPAHVFMAKAQRLIGKNARFKNNQEFGDLIKKMKETSKKWEAASTPPLPAEIIGFLFCEGCQFIYDALEKGFEEMSEETPDYSYIPIFIASCYCVDALLCQTGKERLEFDEIFCAGVLEHQPFSSHIIHITEEIASSEIVTQLNQIGALYKCSASESWRSSLPLFAFAFSAHNNIVGYEPTEKFAFDAQTLWDMASNGESLSNALTTAYAGLGMPHLRNFSLQYKIPEKNNLFLSVRILNGMATPSYFGVVLDYDPGTGKLLFITSPAKTPMDRFVYGAVGASVQSATVHFQNLKNIHVATPSSLIDQLWVLAIKDHPNTKEVGGGMSMFGVLLALLAETSKSEN